MFDLNSAVLLFITFVVGLGIFLLVLFWYFNPTRKGFYRKAQIQSFQERRFFRLLNSILKNNYYILAQVRLATVVTIPGNYFIWEKFSLLGAKCVDFVVCDKVTGETKLVIELDDKSHKLIKRQQRDKFVDETLEKARIPILHQPLLENYNEVELIDTINRKIGF